METFTLAALRAAHAGSGHLYHEFLRMPTMSAGIYRLAAGAADPQRPHAEDELYQVLEGRAVLRVGDEDRPVGPGSLIFVEANTLHRFHTVTEDLTVLVFFAPAEYSRGGAGPPPP